jgi:hypothetical protein
MRELPLGPSLSSHSSTLPTGGLVTSSTMSE